MPRHKDKILNSIEEQVLTHIAATEAPEVVKRATVLLAINSGHTERGIAEKLGVSKNTVGEWKKRWLSHEAISQTWDEALAKTYVVLGDKIGRPKKVKDNKEITKIIEISEWNKTHSPCRSKHQHNKAVAETVKSKGLAQLSPRTVGRLLENTQSL
ncbi:hypothetical protein CAL7716_103010 (plasmid) [Calothrix sp. PCC 7716]|nr:hypothetical protein CAL7716_103010 [Calothrix sp. PCC 7716]